MMKNSEIRELSTEDLKVRLSEEKSTLTKLKFTHAVSALENPNVLKNTRKTIARIATELSARKNGEIVETAAETN